MHNSLSFARDIKVTAVDVTNPDMPKALCQLTFKPKQKRPLTDGAVFCRLRRVNRDNKWAVSLRVIISL